MLPTILAAALLALLGGPASARAADLADAPCYECHDELRETFAQGRVHPPVQDGECDACHEDHGDDERLVLADRVPALCYQCHDEWSASHPHEPVSAGDCLDCHRVHNSPERRLLTQAVPSLCFDCHDEYGEGGSVHPPVADGECVACHAPHGSSKSDALLVAGYSRERYVDFSEEAYELCFGCHDAESFREAGGAGTSFRDGERNLHRLHLIGEEGEPGEGAGIRTRKRRRISCDGCHLVHASPQDRLIRPSAERGKMTLYVIQYTARQGGGSCVVGCHKPQEYRAAPGAKPRVAGAGGAKDRRETN